MAVQRRMPARSPNTTMASSVAKIGAENDNAVTSAKGVIASAVKNASIEMTLSTPLSVNNPSLAVRSGASPRRTNHGTTTISPNTLRKNAISNGCSAADTWRMQPCMVPMASVKTSIHRMPFMLSIGAGAGSAEGIGPRTAPWRVKRPPFAAAGWAGWHGDRRLR